MVSVIVPIYKCEKTLPKCIDSILNQTYPQIEVLLVIDGFNEALLRICEDYSAIDSRVIIIQQSHSGVSVARNKGIECSTGEWLFFVDADDWIEADCIEKLVYYTPDFSYDCVISGFYVDANNHTVEKSFFTFDKFLFDENNKNDLLINCIINTKNGNGGFGYNVGVPWAKLYKKSIIYDYNIRFFPGLKRMEDTLFNLNFFWHASKVYLLDRNLYHYYINADSVTKNYSSDYFETVLTVASEIDRFAKLNGVDYISEALNERKILFLLETIIYQIIPDECKMSVKEKVNSIKKLYFTFLDQKIIDEHITKFRYLTLKQKISYFLVKYNFNYIVYFYLKLKYMVNQHKII